MKRWTMWLSGIALVVTFALAQTGCATRTATAEDPDRNGYYASPVTSEFPGRPTSSVHIEAP